MNLKDAAVKISVHVVPFQSGVKLRLTLFQLFVNIHLTTCALDTTLLNVFT